MERTCIPNLNWTSSCYVTVVSFSSFEDLLAKECAPTKQWSLGCTCSAEMCQGTVATDIIAMLQHVIQMQGRSHFQQKMAWNSRRTKWLRIMMMAATRVNVMDSLTLEEHRTGDCFGPWGCLQHLVWSFAPKISQTNKFTLPLMMPPSPSLGRDSVRVLDGYLNLLKIEKYAAIPYAQCSVASARMLFSAFQKSSKANFSLGNFLIPSNNHLHSSDRWEQIHGCHIRWVSRGCFASVPFDNFPALPFFPPSLCAASFVAPTSFRLLAENTSRRWNCAAPGPGWSLIETFCWFWHPAMAPSNGTASTPPKLSSTSPPSP